MAEDHGGRKVRAGTQVEPMEGQRLLAPSRGLLRLSYTKDPGPAHSELGPPTAAIQPGKCSTDSPTAQSDEGNSSTEVSLSLAAFSLFKLTKTAQHTVQM